MPKSVQVTWMANKESNKSWDSTAENIGTLIKEHSKTNSKKTDTDWKYWDDFIDNVTMW